MFVSEQKMLNSRVLYKQRKNLISQKWVSIGGVVFLILMKYLSPMIYTNKDS